MKFWREKIVLYEDAVDKRLQNKGESYRLEIFEVCSFAGERSFRLRKPFREWNKCKSQPRKMRGRAGWMKSE